MFRVRVLKGFGFRIFKLSAFEVTFCSDMAFRVKVLALEFFVSLLLGLGFSGLGFLGLGFS